MPEKFEQTRIINKLSDVNKLVENILEGDQEKSPFFIMNQVYETVRLNNAILGGYLGEGSIKDINFFMQDNKECEVYDMTRFKGDEQKEIEFLDRVSNKVA